MESRDGPPGLRKPRVDRHTKYVDEGALRLCSGVRSLASLDGQPDLRLSDASHPDLVRVEDSLSTFPILLVLRAQSRVRFS